MVPGNVFVFYMQLLKHCPVDDLSLSTKRSVKAVSYTHLDVYKRQLNNNDVAGSGLGCVVDHIDHGLGFAGAFGANDQFNHKK